MTEQNLKDARKLPHAIRAAILAERLIEVAVNYHEFDSPMEYLFDVYHEYIDPSGMNNDFACHKCRQKVLDHWHELLPSLQQLEQDAKAIKNK